MSVWQFYLKDVLSFSPLYTSVYGCSVQTMHTVNAQVKLPELQKTMMNYEKESAKMDMAGELSE